mmetsp:Transcript_41667/g.116089  ORF Transcript_41667/g.116089 Transcript_41667/m.116089 type:complete len:516 (-) Transcript_41667:310-1857(-)
MALAEKSTPPPSSAGSGVPVPSPFGPPEEAQHSQSSGETLSGDSDAAGLFTPGAATEEAPTPGPSGASFLPGVAGAERVAVVCDTSPAQGPEDEVADGATGLPGYPEAAAAHFGECFAHRLRWAHAVNSRRRLRGALATPAHFLEADVASGPLLTPSGRCEPGGAAPAVPPDAWPAGGPAGPGPQRAARVCTRGGEAVIMAHYPTEHSSDLSLERFVHAVLRHNERIASPQSMAEEEAAPTCGLRSRPLASEPVCTQADAGGSDEAAAFARDLNKELDAHAAVNGGMITACVGSRRDRPVVVSSRRTRKGIKLDFKQFDCVEPTITFLRQINAAKKLEGHLWLNADVFAGPGALITPLNAKEFVRLCAENLPEAVLSLSWGASIISATRLYTDEMIERMIELCMSPIVQQPLEVAGLPQQGTLGGGMYLTPAATCQHITFAVAAEYALGSAGVLRRLLESVPGASLTIYSGVGSLGITPAHVQDLINTYGKRRCFLDLRVSKPWRSCTNGNCAVQ